MLVARVSSLEDPLFYYFFTLLFLQYVNELFAGLQSLSNSRTAILSSVVTSNNAVISRQPTIGSRQCAPKPHQVPLQPFYPFNSTIKLVCLMKFFFFTPLCSVNNFQFSVCSLHTAYCLLPTPLVENIGFEPMTPCLQSRCSSQLS